MSSSNPYPYLLHSVEAENVRDSYVPFDTVDFNLNFENRAIILGSIRLEGNVSVVQTPDVRLKGINERVSNDHRIGVHSYFHSFQSQMQNIGNVENIVEYPRMVATMDNGRLSDNDLCSAKYVCEGRSPDIKVQRSIVQDRVPVDKGGGPTGTSQFEHRGSGFQTNADKTLTTGGDIVVPDFSIKPKIALNNVVSPNALLNYATSGQIRISTTLERDIMALQNMELTDTYTYSMKNLRITFASVPAVTQQPVQMRSHLCLKSTINSNLSNTSSKVPAIVDSVFISFLKQDRENKKQFNNTSLEKIPSLDVVRFMFNDSTSKYISYEIKKVSEMVMEGIKAVNKANPSQSAVTLSKLDASKSFMIGLDMGAPINLANQKFNVQIESGATSTTQFLMFAYFSSLLSV